MDYGNPHQNYQYVQLTAPYRCNNESEYDRCEQVCEISGEVIVAATHTMADKFTPINSCFELFTADFLIDAAGSAWLLEVNEMLAFYEVGFARSLSLRLMESVVCVAMEHMTKAAEG